jgi:hypothetical protein
MNRMYNGKCFGNIVSEYIESDREKDQKPTNAILNTNNENNEIDSNYMSLLEKLTGSKSFVLYNIIYERAFIDFINSMV